MKIAVYPGSFDPISNGHLDIIERTSKVFDKVYVLISVNPNKEYMFSVKEKEEMIKKATKHIKNVEVEAYDGLVLDYAKLKGASVIIRGLRNFIDYQDEITLFQFNRSIDENIDTFVLFPSANNLFLSSSAIKQLVKLNADISKYVPACLKDEIEAKIKERTK